MFGELLEAQFEEMWRVMSRGGAVGEPAPDARFDLVEAAAGNGRLARDILDHAAVRAPRFYQAIRLHLVERSPLARAEQAETLGPHAQRLATGSAELPAGVRGVIYANELLDALAPHLVVMRDGGQGWPSNMGFLATADPKTSSRSRFCERALGIQRERVSGLVHPWRMLGAPPRLPPKSEGGRQTCGNPPRRCDLRGCIG